MIDIVSLYQLAEDHGHDVYWYTDPILECASVQDGDGDCHIAINPFRLENLADERYKLAHELGHCETGAFYNYYATCDIRAKHEHTADKWAIKTLLPEQELRHKIQKHYQRWEIAEHFNVPEPLVEKAIAYYKTQKVNF